MNLQELKIKKPPELLAFAEEQGVEGAAQMRRQELMFSILQKLAANDQVITGSGTIDGSGERFWAWSDKKARLYPPGRRIVWVCTEPPPPVRPGRGPS